MKKNPALFLQHILESIQAIEEYTKGFSEAAFLTDRRTQDAVVRRLEIIGEAVRRLPDESRFTSPPEGSQRCNLGQLPCQHPPLLSKVSSRAALKSTPRSSHDTLGLLSALAADGGLNVREMPPIRYARSGDVNIAYQITGEGNSIDMVSAPGTVSHLAVPWQRPGGTTQIDRFSRFCRLIRFDKRGTGMSDRVTDAATLEERADDIRAVMDAAGSERAAILGASEGGSMACVFAALHPERVRALIVWGCQASFVRTADYPWGDDPKEHARKLAALERDWPSEDYVRTWGAGLGDAPQEVIEQTLSRMQLGASPSAIVALERMNSALDIRDVLPSIHVPTLVMARDGDPMIQTDAVRDLATRIPGARLKLFPGRTHYMAAPWAGIDGEPVWSTIEEFVTGSRTVPSVDRFLTTVLFLDVVQSTERATSLGDRAWRDALDAYYRIVREELDRAHGIQVDTAGDGFLATFDGPARAVRFAFAVIRRVKELGFEVRAGLHCGEIERAGEAIRGIAVHVASRIAAAAGANEVLVSTTIRDLTAGSGLHFVDRGFYELKGIPEPRLLLQALD